MTIFTSNSIRIDNLHCIRNYAAEHLGRLVFLLTLCTATEFALAASLPATVTDQIEQELPAYTWHKNARHLVLGDFDGNGFEDVAVLLSGEEDWQLAAFRQIEKERYQLHKLDSFPGNNSGFKKRFPLQDLTLKAIDNGNLRNSDATTTSSAAEHSASIALHLPDAEKMAMLFTWNATQQLFGASRLNLTPASVTTNCAYDPDAGVPNPLGMRAFVTIEAQDGNTIVRYEQFPQRLEGPASATIAIRREMVFYQTSIDSARAYLREHSSYYESLTGDNDSAGFASIDATLACK